MIFVITKAETLFFVGGRKWSSERPDAMEFATLDDAERAIDDIPGVESSEDELGQWKQTDDGPVWQQIVVAAEDVDTRTADRIDGYDRDDIGESPDY